MARIQIWKSLLMISLMTAFAAAGCGTAQTDRDVPQEPAPVSAGILEEARVSYLGPAGTYTEEAAMFFFPDASALMPALRYLTLLSLKHLVADGNYRVTITAWMRKTSQFMLS